MSATDECHPSWTPCPSYVCSRCVRQLCAPSPDVGYGDAKSASCSLQIHEACCCCCWSVVKSVARPDRVVTSPAWVYAFVDAQRVAWTFARPTNRLRVSSIHANWSGNDPEGSTQSKTAMSCEHESARGSTVLNCDAPPRQMCYVQHLKL